MQYLLHTEVTKKVSKSSVNRRRHLPDVPMLGMRVITGVQLGLVIAERRQQLGPFPTSVVEHLRLEQLESDDREVQGLAKLQRQ